MSAGEAPKLDGGKPPVHLVVPEFILAIARVLAFGAKKYAAWSWLAGKPWSKDYSALQRHLMAWWGGEDLDPESGEPHLAHAACDLMFLFASRLGNIGTDDRMALTSKPVQPKPQAPAYYFDHMPKDKWSDPKETCPKSTSDGMWGCTRPTGHYGKCEYSDGTERHS